MIPLLLLALGLGALATYEFSPKTHEWVDAHVQAVRDALHANDAASANLDAAHATIAQSPLVALPTAASAVVPHVAAAAQHVATAAQKAAAAKKAATALGDHPAADAAHRAADLLAALAAAKADETEATFALVGLQGAGYGSSPQAQLLQQRIATAQDHEALYQHQLALMGQLAGTALRQGLSSGPSSGPSPAKAPDKDPWA